MLAVFALGGAATRPAWNTVMAVAKWNGRAKEIGGAPYELAAIECDPRVYALATDLTQPEWLVNGKQLYEDCQEVAPAELPPGKLPLGVRLFWIHLEGQHDLEVMFGTIVLDKPIADANDLRNRLLLRGYIPHHVRVQDLPTVHVDDLGQLLPALKALPAPATQPSATIPTTKSN